MCHSPTLASGLWTRLQDWYQYGLQNPINIHKKAPIDDTVPHQNSRIPGLILYFGGFGGGSQLPASDAMLLVFPQMSTSRFHTWKVGDTGENAQVTYHARQTARMRSFHTFQQMHLLQIWNAHEPYSSYLKPSQKTFNPSKFKTNWCKRQTIPFKWLKRFWKCLKSDCSQLV